MAREFIEELNLQPNSTILDAGCGLGGSAFLMAEQFGLSVDGIDLSENMIRIAQKNGVLWIVRSCHSKSRGLYGY